MAKLTKAQPRAAGRCAEKIDLRQQKMASDRLVFTSSQAARYLGISLATVRRWSDAGHLAYYRTPGGQRRFSREQLDRFMASMHQPEGGSADGAATAAVARRAA